MTDAPAPHVLFLNSGKVDAFRKLREVAPHARVEVVTEKAYEDLYPVDQLVHHVLDIADPTEVRDLAVRIHQADPFDAVVAPSERSLQVGGYLRSFLGLGHPGYEVSHRFSSKAAMKRALAAAGVAVAPFVVAPSWRQVADAARSIGWPVVVKPSIGSGSMNTFVVRSDDDLTRLWQSGESAALRSCRYSLMVEAFVDIDVEYHCDAAVVGGVVEFSVLQRYFGPLLLVAGGLNGSVVVADDDPAVAAVRDLHQRVVDVLGLVDGVTHLEVLRHGDTFLVGEISCRPGGGGIMRSIELQWGVDLWKVFLQTQLGMTPDLDPRRQRQGRVVNCDLPVQVGRVVTITPASHLADLPGVIDVETCAPGTTFTAPLNSTSATGLVFAEVADDRALEELLTAVRDRFRVTFAH